MATLFENGRLVDAHTDIPRGWLVAENGVIARMGEGDFCEDKARFQEIVDCTGQILMPGVIDEHVHFREPGLTQKADMATESRAAAAGGVTSFFDMPNTQPATVSREAWQQKMELAARKSVINYAFFIGATPHNLDFLACADYKRIPGIKLFMGATTGAEATDGDDFLNCLFECAPATIAVHAEDEAVIAANRAAALRANPSPSVERHPDIRSEQACVSATRKITAMARNHHKHLHVMHISTQVELDMLDAVPLANKLITAETCPQYLLFNRKDYAVRGVHIKCNPAIKENSDQTALVEAVRQGRIDTIGTDHAPHLLRDKEGGALTAASGMPGVQFALPLMLTLAHHNNIDLNTVSRLMSGNPAIIWHVDRRGFLRRGYHADLTLVERADNTITHSQVVSKCGWTPYDGFHTSYVVKGTWVNGCRVYGSGAESNPPPAAASVEFNREKHPSHRDVK